ncbi:MAG TPA: EI24 domain-containing protein [Planctomycetota bacterium]|nr:EI24 domain-containing protein [Planctomycetota bacterium]
MIPNPTPCPICGYPPSGFGAPAAASAVCATCGSRYDTARFGAPDLAGSSAGAAFVVGFAAYFRGAYLLFTRPRTKRWAIVPVLISIAIVVALFFGLWHLTEAPREWASTAAWMPAWMQAVTRVVLGAIVVVLFFVFAWFASAAITTAVGAPFLDPLVGRADEELLGRRPTIAAPFVRDAVFSIVQSIAILPVSIAVSVVALALAFIPAAGPFLSLAILALGYGLTAIDVAGARRRWTLRQKWRVARGNLSAIFGFGTAAAVVSLVPVLPIVLGVPASALGAALLVYPLDLRPARLAVG